MITNVWEFKVKPGKEAEFERFNSHEGEWARLFGKSPDYLETRCFPDEGRAGWYVTEDDWTDYDRFERFVEANRKDFDGLDEEQAAMYESARNLEIKVEDRVWQETSIHCDLSEVHPERSSVTP